ncbi:MAG: hypothetical protein ACLS3M_04230 [Collinsella sp.]
MLMTAHPGIGEDANLFFRNLSLATCAAITASGCGAGRKPLIITRPGSRDPARPRRRARPCVLKLNSLTDRDVNKRSPKRRAQESAWT